MYTDDFEKAFRDGWKSFENVVRKNLKRLKEHNTHHPAQDMAETSLKKLYASRFSGITADIFETHKSVVARILLPEGMNPHSINITHDRSRLYISGVPGKRDEVFALPEQVRRKRSKAIYSSGVVEVWMKKRKAARQARTLRVKYK
jgi:HSP20 family molecular chaperone IbpA